MGFQLSLQYVMFTPQEALNIVFLLVDNKDFKGQVLFVNVP